MAFSNMVLSAALLVLVVATLVSAAPAGKEEDLKSAESIGYGYGLYPAHYYYSPYSYSVHSYGYPYYGYGYGLHGYW